MRKIAPLILIFFLLASTAVAQNHIEITFEDYNDQDTFNNFSGNWNKWEHSPGTCNWSFDTVHARGGNGACLRVDYSVPSGGYAGLWNSFIGKVDFDNHHLDFTDLYGDLKNSSGNPADIEDVQVTLLNFWAKGNGTEGAFDHVVKVEVKDTDNNIASQVFTIPNMSDWTKYEFPVTQMSNVDLTHMKEVVFVLTDYQNDYRTSHFFWDDLSFSTTETSYDASTWSDDEFLDLVAHRAFKYFLTFTDDLGFALDRSTFSDRVRVRASVAAIGFQLTAYCIGHQRNWADDLESRVETILQNLASLPMGLEPGTVNAGYKGFFYHFLEANTGKRENDLVELSLYDTTLLMHGILSAKECFPDNPNIQALAQSLYDSVEWSWMVDTSPGDHEHQFFLAWKPETGFEGHVDGYTDEALLVDVLALGSNTHPTTMATYNARSRHFGVYPSTSSDSIAAAWTGSLFNYFFASCWLDLENRGVDRHATYPLNIWENNRRAIVANRQFCINHQDTVVDDGDDKYTTYSELSWGLTACDNLVDPSSGPPSEYYAFGALPTQQNIQYSTDAPHLGTIAVYGAGSSIMYTPSEAISALRHYYSNTCLWSPLFGFGDAYSTDPHYFEIDEYGNLEIHPATWLNGGSWVNHMMMGIDEGPMLLAIENYRSGLIWNLTNRNPNVKAGLDTIFGPLPCLGDLDHDGDVDGSDLAVFAADFGRTDCANEPLCEGDFDGDGDVDGSDLAVFAADFGRTDCPDSQKVPYIEGYSNSGCLYMSYGASEKFLCGEDEIIARVEGDSVFVEHNNAIYNCCADDIEVTLSSQGNILTLYEKEILTRPCWCLCCYNIYTKIDGLTPGEYTIVVCWQDWERCETVKVIVP